MKSNPDSYIHDITDEIVGLGCLFADDMSIGHIAQDETH